MKIEYKKIHPFYRAANGSLRLGAEPEITSEVSDPNGRIEVLVRLCDGSRTIKEIELEIQKRYPDVTSDEITRAISKLNDAGFIGDASASTTELSHEDLERYNGNIEYFYFHCSMRQSKFEFQEKLKHSNVVILGLGGAGTPTVLGLAAYGVGNLVGVDYDTVELKNLNRQFLYTTNDIGRLKCEVMQERIQAINPTIKFEGINKRILGPQDVEDVIQDADLVICCADEPMFHIQRWVNTACYNQRKNVLFGLSQTIHGRIFFIRPGISGCLDCAILEMTKSIKDYEENFERLRRSNFLIANTVVAPSAMLLGGMIVDEAVRSLTGYLPVRSENKMFELNYTSLTNDIRLSWSKDEGCPTCGTKADGAETGIFKKWDATE